MTVQLPAIYATPGDMLDKVKLSNLVNQYAILKEQVLISAKGADPAAPPTQTTPVTQTIAVGGSYADSGSGNIFQISSWADNTGTRNTVAIFGQARALGASSRAWGGNFVGYTGAAGAFAQTVELDFGVANGISGQQAWGLAVNAGGTTGAAGNNNVLGINFDSLGAGGIYSRVIRFNNAGLAQPYQGSLIETGNAGGAITAPFGIDFSNAAFGTAAIKTNGFLLDGTGTVTLVNLLGQNLAISALSALGTSVSVSTITNVGAATSAKSSIRLAVGGPPTSPVDGDIWLESNTNTGLKIRINGVTKTVSLV